MDTQQVERELAAILHRRAEDAMNRTNIQEAQGTFQSVVASQPRRELRRWVVAGVAAAVVAVAVGVALWPSGQDLGGSNVPATEVPNVTSAANLAAAEAAAAAFVAHDTDLLAPYLDPGVSPPTSSWATELRRDAAWGVGYLVEPCREVTTNWFACPFELHLLGSREIGAGPFGTNEISVNVRDGKILSAENYKSWRTNGMATHVDSVIAWVKENNPKDADFLLKEEQAVTAAEWPSWTRLWQQSVAEYVAASNEAG